MKKIFRIVLILFCLSITALAADLRKPEDFLGFKVGTERKLADMHQINEYFRYLDEASPRIKVVEVGKTTMGNPFIVAYITSEENQERLDLFRSFQQALADPRKIDNQKAEAAISQGKPIVMINCSIHASEIGASQMSLELAYDLASWQDSKTLEILNNVILILIPMHNPDGIQMEADWYRKNLGTKYEGGRMPWLYHKYVGHDNNRDWYMFTQQETRLTLIVHNAWHPQIVLDMHQMGSRGARIFVPPYIDPYEPNVDPILRQAVAMMGTFIATELTAEGKAGVIHSSGFDAWTPARAYHHYHGGIRILTELASAKLATPITIEPDELSADLKEPSVKMPLPWKGGSWTLRDIIDYDYSAAMAVLTNAARLRENWLRNFYRVHKKAVQWSGSPYAFIVPEDQKDPATTIKLLKILDMGGVEIHQAKKSFECNGCQYPEGTYIIYMAQPYGGFAKALLEEQDYPEIREYSGGPLKTPYDVVAHTLPLLMGIEVLPAEKSFDADTILVKEISPPKGTLIQTEDAMGFLWKHETNDAVVALNRLIKEGHLVFWAAEEFSSAGQIYPPGTMVVINNRKDLVDDLKRIINELCVDFVGLVVKPDVRSYALKPVRLGLYKSWTASMNEGWTRWVLEQFEFPYKSVFDEDIRRGKLTDDYDVLIIPDMSSSAVIKGLPESAAPMKYTGGIGEIGIRNIDEFVRSGGVLILLNSACEFAIEHLHIAVNNDVARVNRKDFFIPGSILKVLNKNDHPIAFGYDRDSSVFFRRSPVFSVYEGTSVVTYPTSCFQSGWANGIEYLNNKSAVVDIPFEKGKVIMIGFPALYRGQSHASFRYLFNSIYYGAATFRRIATF
ncbi:MAG: hypothetical protein JW755_04010 [Candidatus Aminicenantes bacterium]|nr:hypothetical protein [Candidatus Aminicenantes bacterium]